MSILIEGMDMPTGNSTKNVLIYSDGTVFTGHENDAQYSACEFKSERKTGAWIEKETFLAEEHGIDVLQSARCTRCGKYHTTPYLYYFKEYAYCPSCGSKNGMRGEQDDS